DFYCLIWHNNAWLF
nr:immunoglobulin light chain junction region [Macaca mulatta]MOX82225.1 immunoglobulin light chain junction region [Macaca mulatta]